MDTKTMESRIYAVKKYVKRNVARKRGGGRVSPPAGGSIASPESPRQMVPVPIEELLLTSDESDDETSKPEVRASFTTETIEPISIKTFDSNDYLANINESDSLDDDSKEIIETVPLNDDSFSNVEFVCSSSVVTEDLSDKLDINEFFVEDPISKEVHEIEVIENDSSDKESARKISTFLNKSGSATKRRLRKRLGRRNPLTHSSKHIGTTQDTSKHSAHGDVSQTLDIDEFFGESTQPNFADMRIPIAPKVIQRDDVDSDDEIDWYPTEPESNVCYPIKSESNYSYSIKTESSDSYPIESESSDIYPIESESSGSYSAETESRGSYRALPESKDIVLLGEEECVGSGGKDLLWQAVSEHGITRPVSEHGITRPVSGHGIARPVSGHGISQFAPVPEHTFQSQCLLLPYSHWNRSSAFQMFYRGKPLTPSNKPRKANKKKGLRPYTNIPFTITGKRKPETLKTIQEPNGEHTCDICGESYAKRKSLEVHNQRSHNPKLQTPCNYPGCNKLLSSKSALKKHNYSHQPEESWPFSCYLCKKRFQARGDIPKHLKTKMHEDVMISIKEFSQEWDFLIYHDQQLRTIKQIPGLRPI